MHSAPTTDAELQHSLVVPNGAAQKPGRQYDLGEYALEDQVQHGLNLFLNLKSPAQFPALAAALCAKQQDTYIALRSLHYVHFARFTPTPDYSTLIVITTYDGDLQSYVMDFVAVLGDVFNAILEFVDGAPPLPVQKYPNEFWKFVQEKNVEADPRSA